MCFAIDNLRSSIIYGFALCIVYCCVFCFVHNYCVVCLELSAYVLCCVFCRHWHVPSSRCLHVMEGHLAAVGAVVITSDGAKAISASNDTTVKIWNTDINSR